MAKSKVIWKDVALYNKYMKHVQNNVTQAAIAVQRRIIQVITLKDIVDTGRLRSSISYATDFGKESGVGSKAMSYDQVHEPSSERDSVKANIGTRVHYAPYLEFGYSTGSRNVAARPFIRAGFEWAKDEVKKLISNKMGK